MKNKKTIKTITGAEVAQVTGGIYDHCWCSNTRPTDNTYKEGEFIGEAVDKEACKSGCAYEEFAYAAYEFVEINPQNKMEGKLKLAVMSVNNN